MKKLIISLACLLGMCSCMKKDDLFDRDKVKEEANKNFPVENIDPEQDWNMAGLKELKVTVNEPLGGTYTLKVYSDNPFNTQNSATLLAKSTIESGKTIIIRFDAPLTTDYIYVVEEAANGDRTMLPVQLTNGIFEVFFGEMALKGRAKPSNVAIDIDYKEDVSHEDTKLFPTTVPTDDKTTQTGYLDVTSNNSAYLKDGANVTFWNVQAGAKIYIMPGATVTVSTQFAFLSLDNITLSIGQGATLIYKGDYVQVGSTGHLYNQGELNIKRLDVLNFAYNGPDAKMTVAGAIEIMNGGQLVNAGVLTGNSLKTTSQGSYINEEETTINGETLLTTAGDSWWNMGTYTTGTMTQQSTVDKAYNTCRLVINGLLKMNTAIGAAFYCDSEASVVCQSAEFNNIHITLGKFAMLKVNETAHFESKVTIHGGDTGRSLFYAKKVTCNGNDNTYSGHLDVFSTDHFGQGKKGTSYFTFKNSAVFKSNVKVDRTACSDGFGETIPEPEDKINVYTCAFEDMTTEAGDYDMNDVVLKIETVPVDGKLKVSLVAAGAMKDLKVYYNGAPFFDDQEVHAALGGPAGTVLNTQGDRDKYEPAIGYIEHQAGKSLAEYVQFSIHDVKTGLSVDLPQFQHDFRNGDAPYGIFVPIDWDYPGEKEPITRRYTYFAGWAENKELYTKWYEEHSGTWPSGEYPYADK